MSIDWYRLIHESLLYWYIMCMHHRLIHESLIHWYITSMRHRLIHESLIDWYIMSMHCRLIHESLITRYLICSGAGRGGVWKKNVLHQLYAINMILWQQFIVISLYYKRHDVITNTSSVQIFIFIRNRHNILLFIHKWNKMQYIVICIQNKIF